MLLDMPGGRASMGGDLLNGSLHVVGGYDPISGDPKDTDLIYACERVGASPFDFDADGRSDISVFRPSSGRGICSGARGAIWDGVWLWYGQGRTG